MVLTWNSKDIYFHTGIIINKCPFQNKNKYLNFVLWYIKAHNQILKKEKKHFSQVSTLHASDWEALKNQVSTMRAVND